MRPNDPNAAANIPMLRASREHFQQIIPATQLSELPCCPWNIERLNMVECVRLNTRG